MVAAEVIGLTKAVIKIEIAGRVMTVTLMKSAITWLTSEVNSFDTCSCNTFTKQTMITK